VRLKTFTAITHMLEDGSWHELDDLREATSFPVEWVQELEAEGTVTCLSIRGHPLTA
jgi:hypothetical protein